MFMRACTMTKKFGCVFLVEERIVLYIMMLNMAFLFDDCSTNGLVIINESSKMC